MGIPEVTLSNCIAIADNKLKCQAGLNDGTQSTALVSLDAARNIKLVLLGSSDFYCNGEGCSVGRKNYKEGSFTLTREEIERAFAKKDIVFSLASSIMEDVLKNPQKYTISKECRQVAERSGEKDANVFIIKRKGEINPFLTISPAELKITLQNGASTTITQKQIEALTLVCENVMAGN